MKEVGRLEVAPESSAEVSKKSRAAGKELSEELRLVRGLDVRVEVTAAEQRRPFRVRLRNSPQILSLQLLLSLSRAVKKTKKG